MREFLRTECTDSGPAVESTLTVPSRSRTPSDVPGPTPMRSSDTRVNRNLTLSEFVSSSNIYRNIMCEVWERRKELDAL